MARVTYTSPATNNFEPRQTLWSAGDYLVAIVDARIDSTRNGKMYLELDLMDAEGFGNCTNTGACEVECPKGISLENIARMNRDYLVAKVTS